MVVDFEYNGLDSVAPGTGDSGDAAAEVQDPWHADH